MSLKNRFQQDEEPVVQPPVVRERNITEDDIDKPCVFKEYIRDQIIDTFGPVCKENPEAAISNEAMLLLLGIMAGDNLPVGANLTLKEYNRQTRRLITELYDMAVGDIPMVLTNFWDDEGIDYASVADARIKYPEQDDEILCSHKVLAVQLN